MSLPQLAGESLRLLVAGSTYLRLFALAACLSLLFLTAHFAFGQAQNTGTISGNVTDTTGGVIPGAKVTLTSNERGTARTLATNERGEYLFPDLAVGTYSLSVESPGFSRYEVKNIVVDADKNIRTDARMQPESVSTNVTVVEAGGSIIDTRSATVGVLIENKLVQDLPVDGGNVVALSGLLPGVTGLNAPTTFTSERGGPTYNSSGSRNTQNLMLFDGSMWNNLFYNTGLNFPPRPALQEVSVLLNNYKAQYGRNAGSVFNVITKSGTNSFHGAIWEYVQNKAFNASDYLSDQNPKLVQNQFGGTIGGPILKDKLFFFAALQALLVAQEKTGTAQTQTLLERGFSAPGVPNPCHSDGNFAGYTCGNFQTPGASTASIHNPLYDSGNGNAAFALNMLQTSWQQAGHSGTAPCIGLLQSALAQQGGAQNLKYPELPTPCFNPVVTNVINQYVPLPNQFTTNASGVLVSTAQTAANQPRNEYNGLIRADYIHGRHSFDARYNRLQAADKTATGVNSQAQGIPDYEVLDNSGTSNFGNLGWTFVITPNLLNVARAGYKRYDNINNPTDHTTWNTLGGDFVVPGVPTLPQVNFNRFSLGSNGQAYSSKVNEDVELDDNVSYTHGNHNFQAGVAALWLQYLNRSQFPGVLQFSTTFTGNVIADGEAGLLNQAQNANQNNQAGKERAVFLFAQDDWRVSPRLTLNVGLRYELNLPWKQPNNQSVTFLSGYQSQIFPTSPAGLAFVGDKGIRPGLIKTAYTGFAPRVGFAYDVFGTGKTSVRGGFGIFFDALNANIIGTSQPFNFRFTYTTPQGGASQPMQGFEPIPLAYDPKNPVFITPISVFFPDKNFTTPYVMAINFGVQQALTRSSTLEVNYIGKFGRHLTVPFDINPAIYDCSGAYYQANPSVYCNSAGNNTGSYSQRVVYKGFAAAGLTDFASVATSNYNGLQVLFNYRASKTLTMLASYSYSRSLDIDTNGQNNNNAIPNPFNLNSEYGPSDFNSTHILNAGWSYYIPKLNRGSAPLKVVVNDWTFGGTYNLRTGLPVPFSMNTDRAYSNEPGQRPMLIPGVNPLLSSGRHRIDKINEFFNLAAFAYPEIGTLSTLSRNKFNGPNYTQTNFTLGRKFPLPWREGMRFDFRADAFNVWNTPNLNQPGGQFSCSYTAATGSTLPKNNTGIPCVNTATYTSQVNGTFNTITSTYGANAAIGTNGRKLQLSLTLYY